MACPAICLLPWKWSMETAPARGATERPPAETHSAKIEAASLDFPNGWEGGRRKQRRRERETRTQMRSQDKERREQRDAPARDGVAAPPGPTRRGRRRRRRATSGTRCAWRLAARRGEERREARVHVQGHTFGSIYRKLMDVCEKCQKKIKIRKRPGKGLRIH